METRRVFVIRWEGLGSGLNTGAPVALPQYPIKTVQVLGTFGAAGNVNIEGSNMIDEPLTYAVLTDTTETALGIVAAGVHKILQNTYWIRPVTTGGDETMDLDVYLLCVTD